MRRGSAGLGATLAAVLSGCLKLNPAYGDVGESEGGSGSGSTGATTSASSTSGGDATTSTGGAAGSSGDATTGAIDPTTGDGSSSSGATTGGEPTVTIAADIATCVLAAVNEMGHVGPAMCEQLVVQDAGLSSGAMIVDQSYDDPGGGRPGLVFIRFDIPAQIGALGQVVAARLVFRVAEVEVAASGAGGAVRLAMPFTGADLETKAPGWIPGFEELLGAVDSGQQVEVELPPAAIAAGAPLHVGIWPYSDDAAIYLSKAAPGPLQPRLELTLMP